MIASSTRVFNANLEGRPTSAAVLQGSSVVSRNVSTSRRTWKTAGVAVRCASLALGRRSAASGESAGNRASKERQVDVAHLFHVGT